MMARRTEESLNKTKQNLMTNEIKIWFLEEILKQGQRWQNQSESSSPNLDLGKTINDT